MMLASPRRPVREATMKVLPILIVLAGTLCITVFASLPVVAATSPAMKACSQQWVYEKRQQGSGGRKVVGFLESVQQGFCGQERRRHSDGRKAFGREAG